MTVKEVVQEFCDLMVKRDPDLLVPYLHESVVYQNVGMAPVAGADEVIANLRVQFEMFPDGYEFQTIHCAAEGELVLNERLDKLKGPNGLDVAIPVMGAFTVRDNKIIRWTDYWDSGLLTKMMSGEDCTSLMPSY